MQEPITFGLYGYIKTMNCIRMLPTSINCEISRFDNLRSCVAFFFLLLCFFGSKGKKNPENRLQRKGEGMITDWRFDSLRSMAVLVGRAQPRPPGLFPGDEVGAR